MLMNVSFAFLERVGNSVPLLTETLLTRGSPSANVPEIGNVWNGPGCRVVRLLLLSGSV